VRNTVGAEAGTIGCVWALSDLHVGHAENREFVQALTPRPRDWLLLAGDVAEEPADLVWALERLGERFARLVWVPGNHELWGGRERIAGPARYRRLVEICRERRVLTPEDEYPLWSGGEGERVLIAPLFLHYDHSFSPGHVGPDATRAWARALGIGCADDRAIDLAPFASAAAWCVDRLRYSVARIEAARGQHPGTPLVLLNHYPLRVDLVRLVRIHRFAPWCGTLATADWPRRFGARVVVYGHLHMAATDWRGGVRHEEVSLGYPGQRRRPERADELLRLILPEGAVTGQRTAAATAAFAPERVRGAAAGPRWYR
jgi:3',5'-cyclic AMP phosphodiesterase CpdA